MTAWLIGIAAALAGVIGAWLRGRSQGRRDAKARQDSDTIKTVERIQDAKDRSRDAGGDWRERLRRSKRD